MPEGQKPSRQEQQERRSARAANRKAFARGADLSTVGMVFPIALLLGYFGGGIVGGWFGREQLGTWIGLGLGLVSGFYNLLKVALVLQRREQFAQSEQLSDGVDKEGSSSNE